MFYTPILLLFVLPKSAENILVFFRKFTKHVDGVGHVCAFADFDIETFGNPKVRIVHSSFTNAIS